jgi:MobA/MobL family/RepB DNA-primase from phage plasmid
MAIYHLSVSKIKRSAGRTATGAAAYRAAQEIHDERTGITHDYTRKRGVYTTEILTPAHAPDWMRDRVKLWNGVEHREIRKDAELAREIDIALPAELSHDQKQDLVRRYVQEQFISKGMVADIAYHDLHKKNPHVHILLTLRTIDGEGFGNKQREWNDKALLQQWREAWAQQANHALEQAGHAARIDHRTLEDQAINRMPQIHLGPKVNKMLKGDLRHNRVISTERGEKYQRIATINRELQELEQQIAAEQENLHQEPQKPVEKLRPAAINQEMTTPPDPAPEVPHPQPTTHQPPAPQQRDRTHQAISRQLRGMGAEQYEVGLRDSKTGKMLTRTWTPEQVENSAAWLKRLNSQGRDVYIRPAGSTGLILVDDLNLGSLERMRQDGFKPAAITQTSPLNYQAWVRLSDQPIPQGQATAAAKILAERYGGDPNSADWRHFGRLAGFTNQKGIHTRSDGKQPYVLLESYHGKIAINAQNLLIEADERLKATQLSKQRQTPSETKKTRQQPLPKSTER